MMGLGGERSFMDSFVDRINLSLKRLHIPKWKFYEDLGLANNTSTNWSKRGTVPSADVALRIADYLGVSVRYLVTGQDEEGISPRERELLDVCKLMPDRKFSIVLQNARAVRADMEAESGNGLSSADSVKKIK